MIAAKLRDTNKERESGLICPRCLTPLGETRVDLIGAHAVAKA